MNTLRKHTLTLILAFMAFGTFDAVSQQRAMNEDQRKEWLADLRNFKHNFLKKELGLTREQETPFFEVYDRMDDELMALADETRALERKTISDQDATDVEIDAATRAIFEQKSKEAEIEMKGYEELKQILNRRQLLNLKEAERKMNRMLLNHSRKARKPDKK